MRAIGCVLPLAAALALCASCISVVNNIGDSAISAARAGTALSADTNRVESSTASTNTWTATASRTSRGGLIVSTTINKNVSPNTTTTIPLVGE